MSKAKQRKRQAAERRTRAGALSGQARTVLGLVFLFTAAFVAVILMKISQEWDEELREAELRQARNAAYFAERANANLARIQGAAAAAAAAREVEWSRSSDADPTGHLRSLADRDDVFTAALLTGYGAPRAGSSAGVDDALAEAAATRQGRAVWTAPAADGGSGVFLAERVLLSGEPHLLIARVDPLALAPPGATGQTVALVSPSGRVLASRGAGVLLRPGVAAAEYFAVDAELASRMGRERGGALPSADGDETERRILGVAPMPRSGLAIYASGPRLIDRGAWRRTLVFYLLLLAAPILVSAGLCAVLLMQMDNIRQARAALQESEQRLTLAIDGARCGVWDWDVANDAVYVTQSLARMLGMREPANLSSSEFLGLIRREDQEDVKVAIRGAPGNGEVDVEFRATSLPVWLHMRGRPWTGVDGQLSGRIVGVAIDVTEQKGAQARVVAAQARLDRALESMGESFALYDARRRLVMSNPKFRDFFHLDGKLVKTGAAQEMLELAARAAIKTEHNGAEAGARELELADGRWVYFTERRTEDGGLVTIGTDITALKQQETQLIENDKRLRKTVTDLRQAQDRLAELARSYEREKIRAQEANRTKSEFLANMSHELRTPLNAINGFSDVMIQQMFGPLGDARYEEYARDILASGQHLLALINDVLDMSRIEAGKMQLSPEPVFPDEIAEQCARFIRGKAKEADLELVIDVGELPQIEADARAIKQVLLNLLSNAVKFTPEGGRVTLSARRDATGIAFSVTDTGIGIGAEDLPRIGKPFEQIENQTSKSHPGSGLGLALSKSLVEMHGGELSIESALGEGTTVSFRVPFKHEPSSEEPAAPPQDAVFEAEEDDYAGRDEEDGDDDRAARAVN